MDTLLFAAAGAAAGFGVYALAARSCRSAGIPLSRRQLLWIVPVCAALWALPAALADMSRGSLFSCALASLLLLIAVVDQKTLRVPNVYAAALAVLGLLGFAPGVNISARSGLIGAAVGGGLLLLLKLVRPDGIGGGDVKLIAAGGLSIGYLTPLALALAAGVTLAALLVRSPRGRPAATRLPLAPGLAFGLLAAHLLRYF